MYHTVWTYFELRKWIKSCQLLEKSSSYYYGFKQAFYKIMRCNKKIHPFRVCLISIWTILWDFLVTGWFEIIFFDSCEQFMKILLKVNRIYFCDIKHGLTMTSYFWKLNFEIAFLQGTLDIYFAGLKMLKTSNFDVTLLGKKLFAIK